MEASPKERPNATPEIEAVGICRTSGPGGEMRNRFFIVLSLCFHVLLFPALVYLSSLQFVSFLVCPFFSINVLFFH